MFLERTALEVTLSLTGVGLLLVLLVWRSRRPTRLTGSRSKGRGAKRLLSRSSPEEVPCSESDFTRHAPDDPLDPDERAR
jgi:hypothetical protein